MSRRVERHPAITQNRFRASSGPKGARIFFLQLRVVGSTMGTLDELRDLLDFVATTGITPEVGQELPMSEAAKGFRAMSDGDTAGKIVFTQ